MIQNSNVHAHIVDTLLPNAGGALCCTHTHTHTHTNTHTAIGNMDNEVLNRTKNTIILKPIFYCTRYMSTAPLA